MGLIVKFENVFIENLSAVEAPERVTSAAIEDQLAAVYARLGIPPRCIESLVGIQARRFWEKDFEVDAAATLAGRRALDTAASDHPTLQSEIGALINTSVSKEYLEPSVSAMVHGALGLPATCLNFDVSNACLGFVSGMTIAAQMIESQQIPYALVIAGESSRKVVQSTIQRLQQSDSTMQDYRDYLPTLTLGSGAVAMLLCHRSRATKGHQFLGVTSLAATAHSRICLGTYDWMRTDAPKLLTEGIGLASRTWAQSQQDLGWAETDISQYICHQVGATHLAALLKALELQREKAFLTYPEFGNMGSAALPFTLAKALDAGAFTSGDIVALMGIGSGLNCSMAKVLW